MFREHSMINFTSLSSSLPTSQQLSNEESMCCDYSHLVSHYEFVNYTSSTLENSIFQLNHQTSTNISNTPEAFSALSELLIQLGHVLFENWEEFCGEKGFERLCEKQNPTRANSPSRKSPRSSHRVHPFVSNELDSLLGANECFHHHNCKEECALRRFFKLTACQQIHLATNFICNFVCYGVNGSIMSRIPTKLYENTSSSNNNVSSVTIPFEPLRFGTSRMNRLSVVSESYFNYPDEKDTPDSLMVLSFLMEVLRDLVRKEIEEELKMKREELSSIFSQSTTCTDVSYNAEQHTTNNYRNNTRQVSVTRSAATQAREEETLLQQHHGDDTNNIHQDHQSYYWRAFIFMILRKVKFGNLYESNTSQEEILQAASSTELNIWNTLISSLFRSFIQKKNQMEQSDHSNIRRRALSNSNPTTTSDTTSRPLLQVPQSTGTRTRAVSSGTASQLSSTSVTSSLEKSSAQIKRLQTHFNSFFSEHVIHQDMCKLAFVCQISAPLFMRSYKNLGEKYLRTLFSNSRGTLRKELLAPLEASNQLSFVTVCYWHSFMAVDGYDSALERIKAFYRMLEKCNFPLRSPGPKTPKQPAGLKTILQKLKTLI
ncbi:hypothetical protein C9374_012137 [Naegleria lovaniensis]|uniref:Uncharacterized protein n=1 Tax=Naegleria lovaniensis TaxID=51637 RepID=A0AA88KCL7_NAELO|nr:uncharacterized protein C9374_012137 [Naegleria lovaniensis]KAG2373398.1 hypothetical protein C9374_012137 [Naegleria lovaniensis]